MGAPTRSAGKRPRRLQAAPTVIDNNRLADTKKATGRSKTSRIQGGRLQSWPVPSPIGSKKWPTPSPASSKVGCSKFDQLRVWPPPRPPVQLLQLPPRLTPRLDSYMESQVTSTSSSAPRPLVGGLRVFSKQRLVLTIPRTPSPRPRATCTHQLVNSASTVGCASCPLPGGLRVRPRQRPVPTTLWTPCPSTMAPCAH